MKRTTDITRRLAIGYPIIQAPMFGVTTPEMVAAASKAGCLGSLPLGDLSPEKCIETIRATKQLMNKSFAVNLFVNDVPELSEALKERYKKTKKFVEQLAQQHHLDVKLPNLDELYLGTYHDQLDAVINENCKIVSFTFGNLDQQSIQKLKSNGTILIGTCTSVNEALMLERSGIDMICVQGLEAGGHRGSFKTEDIPQIGGLALLSQVFDRVRVPLIYAGGIYNAKTLLASKVLGAQGFQIGSLLLGSAESGLKDFEKERLHAIDEADIVLTKSFSGRYARGVRNAFITAMEDTAHVLPYPYQNKLTGVLRKVAKANKNIDFVNIWVGQSINPYSEQSTAEILEQLIRETENSSSEY